MNFLKKMWLVFILLSIFSLVQLYENFGTLMTTSLRAGSNKHKAFKDFLTWLIEVAFVRGRGCVTLKTVFIYKGK